MKEETDINLTIKIFIKGQEIELTLEEAKRIKTLLNEAIQDDKPNITITPSFPQYPEIVPYNPPNPVYPPYSPYITYSDTSQKPDIKVTLNE